MRDESRINGYIETIKAIWKQYPDLRFTQFILNVFGNNPASYYLEDDKSLEILVKYYESVKIGK